MANVIEEYVRRSNCPRGKYPGLCPRDTCREWGRLCLGGIFRHLPYPHPFTDQGKIRKNVKARVFAMPASNTKLTLDCVTVVKRN